MIKNSLSLLICCASVVSAQVPSTQPAQNPAFPGQTPQNYSYPGNAITNQPTAGGVMFSNRFGQTYSANELAAQLQNLRSIVDQTLPLLSGFNDAYSNSISGGRQTVGGALSGIVSDVFHRNQQPGQTTGTSQGAFSTTNLMAVLHGLLNTNSAGAAGTAPGNAEDLKALETALQPVASILQRLNVSPTPAAFPNQTPYNNGTVPMPNPNISPTGR